MRFFVYGALVFSMFGYSCYAGGISPKRTVQDNTIKGEYVVVINSAEVSATVAEQEMQTAIGQCEVKMIGRNVAHIIIDPSKDPGLEKIKKLLSKFKWVKAIEPNKEVHIS